MNTLRQTLRPDWATAQKHYPLILKRLQDYEAFWDTQPDDTPEAVFDAEYQAMQSYLSELTGKDLSQTWLWDWGRATALRFLLLIWQCLKLKSTTI